MLLVKKTRPQRRLDADIQKVSFWKSIEFTTAPILHWSPLYGCCLGVKTRQLVTKISPL